MKEFSCRLQTVEDMLRAIHGVVINGRPLDSFNGFMSNPSPTHMPPFSVCTILPLPSPTNLSASTFSSHACTSSIYLGISSYFSPNLFLDTFFVRLRTTSTPLIFFCLNLHLFLTSLRMYFCLHLHLGHSYNQPSTLLKHPFLPLNLPTPVKTSSRPFRDLPNTSFSYVCPTIVFS